MRQERTLAVSKWLRDRNRSESAPKFISNSNSRDARKQCPLTRYGYLDNLELVNVALPLFGSPNSTRAETEN
jgi:hypothetical protein